MKTIKYIIPVLLTVSVLANAQTVDRNVTVEREYKPVIQDAGKISSVPEVIEPTTEKIPAVYSEFNLPLPIGQNIYNLSAAELERRMKSNPNEAFLRVGVGNYMNNMLDFALPVVKQPDIRLDLRLNHLATFSKEAHSKTDASLVFDKYFRTLDLYSGIGLGHEYLKYYGDTYNANGDVVDLSALQTQSSAYYKELNLVRINRTELSEKLGDIVGSPGNDVLWRFNAYLGVKSLPDAIDSKYLAEFNYKVFDSRNGLTENSFRTKGSFSAPTGDNRAGVDLEIRNMFYTSDIPEPYMNAWDSYSVLSVNPYYSIERDDWNVRLGIKSSFSFVHGRPFSPSPDISAEWKVVPKWFSLYGGVGGAYTINTMDDMFAENRFLYSDLRVKDTYMPVSVYGGFKVKPVYNLLFDAFANYRYFDNQYFFVNKDYAYDPASATTLASRSEAVIYTNRFNVLYSSASLIRVGGRLNYNFRDIVNLQIKGAYNKWKVYDTEMAWNKPNFDAEASADWKLNRNLTLNANMFFEGERFTKLGDNVVRLAPIADLNLGASYSYLDWFTLFAKVNNLLNNRYQEFYGYKVQGLNVLVGAAFSF